MNHSQANACYCGCTGNPLAGAHVQRLQQGYLKRLKAQRISPTAARPWVEGEVLALVRSLEEERGRVEGVELVAVIRDAFLVTVMWEIQCRGANAGAWRLENLKPKGRDCPLHFTM